MRHHTVKSFTCIDCGEVLHNDVRCPFCDSSNVRTDLVVTDEKKQKRRPDNNRRLFKQLNLFDQKE